MAMKLGPPFGVAWLLPVLLGCDGGSPPPPATSRFEAVTARAPVGDPLTDFCDVRAEPGQGRPLALPALEGSAPTQGTFQWVNLWATWCKPCVEEMPMLASWQKRLSTQGKSLGLSFISVDDSAETVTAFRKDHPSLPDSQRLPDPAALAPLIASLGLDAGAGLPVHVFVEPGAKVRCVRSGAVTEAHYDVVASMLR
jgi:thiol-disulfide isomerase/thioredoxin